MHHRDDGGAHRRRRHRHLGPRHHRAGARAEAADTSTRTLSAIIEVANDAVVSLDEHGAISIFNQGAERIFGYAAAEVLGAPLDRLLPERFRQAHEHHVEAFRAGAAHARPMGARQLVFGLRKSGEEFPAEAAISKVDVGGRRVMTVMLRDVSERVATETALRLNVERLRVAVAASPAVVFNQDLELRYTWIQGPKVFRREQLLGHTDEELLAPSEAPPIVGLKRRVMATGIGARDVVRTSVGGRSYYSDLAIEPLRDPTDGRIVGLTGVTWDVTAQMRRAESERLMAEVGKVVTSAGLDEPALLRAIAELVVRELADYCTLDVVDATGLREVAAACREPAAAESARTLERLRRRAPPAYAGQSVATRARVVTEVTPAALADVISDPELREFAMTLGPKSIMVVPLVARDRLLGALGMGSTQASRPFGEADLRVAGELAREVALAVDNAQLHASLQRAIVARDQVLAYVAHDLRNPLAVMRMQADLMRARGIEPRHADAIRVSATRMDRLIQDLLDVARLDAGVLAIQRGATDTAAVLDDVMQSQGMHAAAAEVGLRLEADADLPAVDADRSRLLQVLENLVGNALKFTHSGGEVVISAGVTGDQVRFSVRDSGCGIAPEHQDRIFDRFWQAGTGDRRGAGLGLAIVKAIVDAHGGQLDVESAVGVGTTFSFALPIVGGAADLSAGTPADAPSDAADDGSERLARSMLEGSP
ncbi:MAG: ATP-binding protein [Myxococcota bacterium]